MLVTKERAMTKNITLSAEESVIEEARKRAKDEHKSLNTVFRDWLFRYAHGRAHCTQYTALMKHLHYASSGRHFSRDEMNER